MLTTNGEAEQKGPSAARRIECRRFDPEAEAKGMTGGRFCLA
jgi:hypothetical protein